MFVTGNLQFFINNFSLIVHKLAQIEQAVRDRQDRSEERISDGLEIKQERIVMNRPRSRVMHASATRPFSLLRKF